MAYGALELGTPNAPACPNQFNEASSLLCPGSTRLVLQVSKQAVMVQLGVMRAGGSGSLGGIDWQTEMPFFPTMASLGRNFDAVRVRNFTSGQEAQVFIAVDST